MDQAKFFSTTQDALKQIKKTKTVLRKSIKKLMGSKIYTAQKLTSNYYFA